MPLYHVQDSDRPLWIVATGFGHAAVKWKTIVAEENAIQYLDVDGPSGIYLLCDDDELVVHETTQRALAECSKTK